ncbi:ABC transporter permease [Granulibacter bethesdensis]|uniref:Amide-urea transport system permease protein n=1 Tax=Granulibacter bethesdensis (strain ATCC BAA-1260 / CGDNIH1) TaxID=391165 RepID=Q0BVY0_GRABC|nr:ABC transporter permease [Granulibacter bethesdensis]ABI61022.1 Amide-urea transport system permease protein [Granulibacter bethesdensis CGDNIH1]APH50796.1 Amide-urea transport system permease protein [Granulibacter bethesdensis]APH63490.1 Amide-urea transport system permease protein [Granulibacter bethesdensis]
MSLFILRRLVQAALTLLGVAALAFLLIHLMPADQARSVAGRSATLEQVARIRHAMGLDRSLMAQFSGWIGGLVKGDLGQSLVQRVPVALLIGERLPATFSLLVGAVLAEIAIGLPAGLLAARAPGRWLDRMVMGGSVIGVSLPPFVVALGMLMLFSVWLGWFPIGGYGGVRHWVLPSVTLGLLGAGWYARMVRAAALNVVAADYIRTARAKGAGETRIMIHHVLRNAALPILALAGTDIAGFLSGAVVVESVFGWPGMGQLVWQAIPLLDVPVILGVTMVAAAGVVLTSLLVDLLAPLIDPRIGLPR